MPAIVEKDVFDKATVMMKKTKHYRKNVYLFKGLAYCKKCNAAMRVTCTTKQSTGVVYMYYQCGICRYTVSDKKIRDSIGNEIVYNYKRDLFNDYLEKVEKRHKSNGSLIRRLNYQILSRKISSETYAEVKYQLDQVDKRICAGIEKEFSRLCTRTLSTVYITEMRLYLLKRVTCILCDPHEFKIIWKRG